MDPGRWGVAGADEDSADFSATDAPSPFKQSALSPYNQDEHRDNVRRHVAIWLLGTLAGVLVLAFGVLIATFFCDHERGERVTDLLMRLMTLVFTPLVALVGSAMGFYFGTTPQRTAEPKMLPPPPQGG